MTAPWDRRSLDEQARVERLELNTWLPAAMSFSPYWTDRANHAGIDLDDTGTRDALNELAPIRERDVTGLGGPGSPALVMRPTEAQVKAHANTSALMRIARSVREGGEKARRRTVLQEYKPVHLQRGGAEGELQIAYTRSDLDRLHRAGARAAAVLGLDDSDYLVSAVPAGPTLDFWGLYHLGLGASMLSVHPLAWGEGLEQAAWAMQTVPVTAVAVLAEEAIELAAIVTEMDVQIPRTDTIVLLGPPGGDEQRMAIRDAWLAAGAADDVRVRYVWPCEEARLLFAESNEDPDGLTVLPDMGIVELVDPITGAPTNGPGDLTVTTLGWHGTALLRYRTGVYVESLLTDPHAPSGRTLPRLGGEVIPGVWQPAVSLKGGGETVADLRGAASVLQDRVWVEAWRIELRRPTQKSPHDRVVIEVAGAIDDDRENELAAALESAMGVTPTQIASAASAQAVRDAAADAGSVFADLR